MLKASLICIIVVTLLAGGASAAKDEFGLGVIVGEPTGFSGKYWLTSNTAIDGAIAWSFADNNAVHLHGDYLLHNTNLIQVDQGTMAIHFGIGGRLKFGDDPQVGVRIPVGLTYLFQGAPVDIFLEIVPILDFAPDTELNPNAAIGVRYFFGRTSY